MMDSVIRGTVGSTGFFACMELQSINSAVSLVVGVATLVFLGLSISKLIKELR
jgi:hypothetical protein